MGAEEALDLIIVFAVDRAFEGIVEGDIDLVGFFTAEDTLAHGYFAAKFAHFIH